MHMVMLASNIQIPSSLATQLVCMVSQQSCGADNMQNAAVTKLGINCHDLTSASGLVPDL